MAYALFHARCLKCSSKSSFSAVTGRLYIGKGTTHDSAFLSVRGHCEGSLDFFFLFFNVELTIEQCRRRGEVRGAEPPAPLKICA